MSRRDALPSDPTRWVFNRLAAAYRQRPGYPDALVDRLVALAGGPGARVADLGAGTGLLALPLAARGALVSAVEPAGAMLDVLAAEARALEGRITPVHAAAEETGLSGGAFHLVVLADALQWVDPERGAREVARLLAPGGLLAVVTPRLVDSPFLSALSARIAAANPKARPARPPIELFFSVAALAPPASECFETDEPLSPERLETVLRSLSYVGPALAPAALEALLADARDLAAAHGGARWTRELRLDWARRGGR